MRKLLTSSVTSVSLLALSVALAPGAALAQSAETPPGVPESSQQDDDPTAAPQEDSDTDATAAESAAPLDTGSGQNEIVVTGSRIARPEFSFPNPIQAYTSESIQQAGATNLTDFLLDAPALKGSTDNQDVAGSALPNAFFTGINLLDLRNLGSVRTLVLVNGRRHIAGYPGTSSVDINTIPVDLIDRVDILTGGTSAIYGADGVSGVVNFVMKRDFEGLSVRGQAGISQRGDAGSRFISATWGKNFMDGRANLAVSYEYNKLDRFSQRKRLNWGMTGPTYRLVQNPNDFDPDDDPNVPDQVFLTNLRWLDSSPGGAIDLNLDYYPDFTGEGDVYDRGIIVPGTSFSIGGSSTPQDSYFGDFTPRTDRHNFNVFGHVELSPAARLFVEGKYVNNKAMTLSQPVYDFYTLLLGDNAYLRERFPTQIADLEAVCAVEIDNGFCSGGEYYGAFVTGRDHFDFGVRRSELERDTYRAVVGLDGQISDSLRYEVSYTFGQTDATATNRNDRLTDRYFAALDAVEGPNGQITCRINLPGETQINAFGVQPEALDGFPGQLDPVTFNPGECVPLNILGEGSPSQAALDWIQVDHTDTARIRQHVLSGYVSGDTGSFFNLPGGPVGFALGAEYRQEKSRTIPDQVSQDGLLADYSTTAVTIGKFDVKEVFAEVNFPILKDSPLAETLAVGGAARLSDYSTVGSTTSWSVNGVYAPVKDITFRGTYSQAVRAPNISELFAGAGGGFFFVSDPCGIDRINNGSSTRVANCTQALQALGIDPADFDPAGDPTSPQGSSIQGLVGSNPDLDAETAKTWTAGVVLRPRFIPGLNLAFDWYDIKIKDSINAPTATELVQLCYDAPSLDNVYCDAISRSPVSGYVNDFTIRPENVAAFDTEGLDMSLNYRFPRITNVGVLNLKINANYLHKLQFIPIPGADVDDDLGELRANGPAPKWSGTGDLTLTTGPLTINYGVNYFSRTIRNDQRGLPLSDLIDADPDIIEKKYYKYKAYWEHQIQFALDVADKANIYFGINNLLDEKPDVGAVGYPVSAVGRFFYAGFKLRGLNLL